MTTNKELQKLAEDSHKSVVELYVHMNDFPESVRKLISDLYDYSKKITPELAAVDVIPTIIVPRIEPEVKEPVKKKRGRPRKNI